MTSPHLLAALRRTLHATYGCHFHVASWPWNRCISFCCSASVLLRHVKPTGHDVVASTRCSASYMSCDPRAMPFECLLLAKVGVPPSTVLILSLRARMQYRSSTASMRNVCTSAFCKYCQGGSTPSDTWLRPPNCLQRVTWSVSGALTSR